MGGARAVAMLLAMTQLVCTQSLPLMPSTLRVMGGLRLKGGSGLPTNSELQATLEVMDAQLEEDVAQLELVNQTAADRVRALQKRWEERAEYMAVRNCPVHPVHLGGWEDAHMHTILTDLCVNRAGDRAGRRGGK